MSERKLSTPEQIEQRAQQLYLERGEDGNDLADWRRERIARVSRTIQFRRAQTAGQCC
jgi:hypothetical protein